jgi:ABC-2 type transport system ATP-binding protein
VIALEAVSARRPPAALESLSLTWGPGIHAALGSPGDGGPLLLAVMAGAVRPRAGKVQVLMGSPADKGVRERVAFVPLEPPLPEAMRVGAVLELAATLRGDGAGGAVERLAALGVEALASRRVRSLSREEARAVALAEATTSPQVRVVLIEEPLVGLDPRAAARLSVVLRERAREGCAIVIATASARDASALADDQILLRRGRAAGYGASIDLASGAAPGGATGARVRIVASDARTLLAALAREPEVHAVAHRDGTVVARGADALALARAAGRAVIDAGVEVIELRVEPPAAGETAL